MSENLDNEMQDLVYSDAPLDLRPDLTFYGIEEVDRGVCSDSFENRSILRASKLDWQIIYTDTGEPSGNILALSPEMKANRALSTLEDRKVLLVDDRNPNSDYITEEALLIEEKSDTLVPLWVIGATRTWLRVKEARKTDPKKLPLIATHPTRCRYIKSDNIRCLLWCSGRATDDGLCRTHLGSKHNNITGAVASARNRAYQAAPTAVAILEQLMESAESEPVKLKAATEILDRAGVRGGIEIDAKIDIEVRPAADVISERLARLLPTASAITAKLEEAAADNVVDAEVVEETVTVTYTENSVIEEVELPGTDE